ncbi:hypothetical protein F4678DRAFT_136886 [Xylaria arbuscula]|nr:hypothetical protein F4678DRAFT_136886 [Xylaria arbuscula]
MPSVPRLRSACDVCHQMKVRCSGTLPCDTCAEAGQTCLYSISNRLGRPPGAKNKRLTPMAGIAPRPTAATAGRSASVSSVSPTMNAPAQRQMVGSASSVEDATTGQHCWVLDRPALPQRHQSDSQTQRLSHQHVLGQITPPDTSTPTNSGAGMKTGDANQVEPQNYSFPSSCDRKRRRGAPGSYDYSAAVGGSWTWSSSGLESIVPNLLPEENTSLEDFTSAVTETLHLADFDILNNVPTASIEQLPQPRAAQISANWSDNSHGSSSYATLLRPQQCRNCPCFEHNSELLCRLKRAGADDGQISDPTKCDIMVKIQEALKTWKGLVECPSCAHDEDTDIVLLALICGRELVTQIQAKPGLLYDDGPTPGHSPSLVLGGYEVKGDEKSMLLHALRSITFRKLERAIICLREVLERKKRLLRVTKLATSPHQDRAESTGDSWTRSQFPSTWNDLAHMDHMLHGIMGLLKALQSAEQMA